VLADRVCVGGFGLAVGGYDMSVFLLFMPGTSGIHTELRVVIPRNTGVVDQQMNTVGFLSREVLCELNRAFLGRDVAGERMQATGASVVCLDCVLEDLLSSSCNVDLCSVRDQSLCDHEANACASTGDHGCDVGDIEEGARLELFVGTLGYSALAMARSGCSNERLTGRHDAFLDYREGWSGCCGC